MDVWILIDPNHMMIKLMGECSGTKVARVCILQPRFASITVLFEGMCISYA